MKTLHLTLKKKWFDMILSGEKKEGYREIKPYWIKRLLQFNLYSESKDENKNVCEDMIFDLRNHSWIDVMESYRAKYKPYNKIIFKNGYSKNAPEITIEFGGIEVKPAFKEWSDDYTDEVFALLLGEIIETKNIKPK